MDNLTKIEKYILGYASYDEEPLEIIILSLLQKKYVYSIREACHLIIKLVNNGLLIPYSHSGKSEDKYVLLEKFNEDEFLMDVTNREKLRSTGKEYYFRTSTQGGSYIDEDVLDDVFDEDAK